MSAPTKPVTVRLPEHLRRRALDLRPDATLSELIVEALQDWIKAEHRKKEDDIIRQAMTSRSAEQMQAEKELAQKAGYAAQNIMETNNG